MSSIIKGIASKIAEKTKAADVSLQKKLVGVFAQNARMTAIMEVSGEAWPIINDSRLDIRTRVSKLDELIHATAVFSGRLKQNPAYGELLGKWEVGFGIWQNLADSYIESVFTEQAQPDEEIQLSDGTVLVVKTPSENPVMSRKEYDEWLTQFANTEVIPKGKIVWDCGVSDDKDISEQWALWMQTATPQQPQHGNVEGTSSMEGGLPGPGQAAIPRTSTA